MIPDIDRTIVALGSSAEGARRAIVRMSGLLTQEIVAGLIIDTDQASWQPAPYPKSYRALVDLGENLAPLPVRILFWPDHRSYTGQPSAELHLIGSLPLAQRLIQRTCELGADPAERGEFTLRAFLAGKLDLAQAEGVLATIEASSPAELQSALEQLGGNLAPAVRPLRDQIVDLLSHLEAGLDFVEEDIEFISAESLIEQLQAIHGSLSQFAGRLALRSTSGGIQRAALVGAPNAGKSSLLNALCQEDRAIVTSIAGTTRDFLTARIAIGDSMFELIDTAGVEQLEGSSPRALAQQQLRECLDTADLIILCVDATDTNIDVQLQQLKDANRDLQVAKIIVVTKSDLVSDAARKNILSRLARKGDQATVLFTSSQSGEGLCELKQVMAETLSQVDQPLALVHHTAVRCSASVAAALDGIERAIELTQLGGGEELVAGELRLVLDELASIIGEVHSDDILGEIFGRFCIGK